jgi:hypothetical protein
LQFPLRVHFHAITPSDHQIKSGSIELFPILLLPCVFGKLPVNIE